MRSPSRREDPYTHLAVIRNHDASSRRERTRTMREHTDSYGNYQAIADLTRLGRTLEGRLILLEHAEELQMLEGKRGSRRWLPPSTG